MTSPGRPHQRARARFVAVIAERVRRSSDGSSNPWDNALRWPAYKLCRNTGWARCVPWTSLICTRVHTHNLSHTTSGPMRTAAPAGERTGWFLSWPYVIRAVAKRRFLIAWHRTTESRDRSCMFGPAMNVAAARPDLIRRHCMRFRRARRMRALARAMDNALRPPHWLELCNKPCVIAIAKLRRYASTALRHDCARRRKERVTVMRARVRDSRARSTLFRSLDSPRASGSSSFPLSRMTT